MHKITSLLVPFLSLLVFSIVKGQEVPKIPINTAVERIQKFLNVYPVEKVHLHFDKPYYAVGDTLWFKMYMQHNFLEYEPSKVGYVDIINGRDSLIQTIRIPLEKGNGNGYFVCDPQFVKQDNYRFRAYTKWMMNFNAGYFFNKVITVGDAINKKLGSTITYAAEGNKTKAQLQFKDSKGAVVGKRKLTWEAIDGWDAFDKGKGETDDMGRTTIAFSAKDKELFKKGRLIVRLEGEGSNGMVGDFSLKNALVDVDVQFFPEGGDLLAGVTKNIAFKALGSDGKGKSVKGKIIDDKKNSVGEFEDLGLGMGYFSLTPLSGIQYKAVVVFDDGQERTFDLPAVKEEGVSLVYQSTDEKAIQIGVISSESYFSKIQNSAYYVFGQLNGHLVYAAQATLKNSSLVISVPKESLPSGIIQFTLMTPQGKAISERLVFNEANDGLALQVKSNKTDYGRKEQVKLDISNLSTEKLPAHLSVAVIDEAKVPYDDQLENTIVSNLLLTSDLMGYVEKPNYYFDKKIENRIKALDALLMTQGFRKFSYEDLVAEKLPKVDFMPEQGISLSGILRLNTGRTYPNGGLLLSIPAKALRKDTYTDQNGRFKFENLVFPDSAKVTINARSNDNYRNLIINMDQSFFPAVDPRNPYTSNEILNIDEHLTSYLANSKNEYRTSILIDEVTVTGVVKKSRDSKEFSALSGLSMADHRVEGERLSGCNVLTMCLTTMLTGITYDNQTLKYYVSRNYNQGSRVPVQFFLNGMPIDEPTLNSIQTTEIEAIEIFLKDDLGTVSRMYQNDGVVSIITKKEKPKGPRMSLAQIEALMPKSNVIDMFPLGYIKERVFYSPKYDSEQLKSTNDYRTTIYWNPSVALDATGQISLDFYNGDGNGKYKVVVEGVDDAGKLGRTIYYYNVK